MRDEARTLENVVEEGDEAIAFMNELLERRNKISEAHLQKLARLVPSGPAKESALLELDGLAARSGIRLASLNFSITDETTRNRARESVAVTRGELKELGENFTLLGSYEGFRAFLRTLENNIRLTDLDAITFSSSDKNFFQFTLQAQSYYMDH